MAIYWLLCTQQLVLICGFTCLKHQERIVHEHRVRETSLHFAGSNRLSASFIIVHLDIFLSNESAQVQPTRLVTFLFQPCWSHKKVLADFFETLWLGHWEAWKPVTQPWQNLMPSETWQTVTCNIHLWSFLLCNQSFEPGSYLVCMCKWEGPGKLH